MIFRNNFQNYAKSLNYQIDYERYMTIYLKFARVNNSRT